jgi:hypothetical protein
VPSQAKVDRQRATARLLLGSVAPAVFGTVLVISLLEVPYAGWTYVVLALVGFAGMVTPYVVGWARSLAGLLIAGVGVLWVLSLPDTALTLRVLAAVGVVAADAALLWWSLRFGHVRKPEDAVNWREGHNRNFPYPYF